MLKKMWICSALFVLLVQLVSAESNSWHALSKIAPGQKIEVVQTDSKAIKGEFSDYDDDSISLIRKGKIVTCARINILTVSLQGPSKRKRHVLIGMAIVAGTGFALGLISTRNDDGFQFVSDEAIAGSLAVIGAGTGALIGAVVPAHGYGIIYKAKLEAATAPKNE